MPNNLRHIGEIIINNIHKIDNYKVSFTSDDVHYEIAALGKSLIVRSKIGDCMIKYESYDDRDYKAEINGCSNK